MSAPFAPEGEVGIRRATAADTAALSSLLAELGHPLGAAEVARRLARLEERAPDDLVLVAERAGAVIGAAAVHFVPVVHRARDIGRISALVVTESERGRGIGRALLRAAEEAIQAQGAERLELTSGARRERAHRFYERLGWVKEGVRFTKSRPRGSESG